MSTKPQILILHGGWHTPASYAEQIAQLEKLGFIVHCPTLPTMRASPTANADMYTDSKFVREYATYLCDRGFKFVVFMHSYGGQVGTNCLYDLGVNERAEAGKAGGILELVYQSGFAMMEGKSMRQWVIDHGHGDLMPLAFNFRDDGFVESRDMRNLVVGPGISDDEWEKYSKTLTTWMTQSWDDKLEHCAWRKIPVTFIQTLQDMTVLLSYQEEMVETMRKEGQRVNVVTIESGQCPTITATKEITQALNEVAAQYAD